MPTFEDILLTVECEEGENGERGAFIVYCDPANYADLSNFPSNLPETLLLKLRHIKDCNAAPGAGAPPDAAHAPSDAPLLAALHALHIAFHEGRHAAAAHLKVLHAALPAVPREA